MKNCVRHRKYQMGLSQRWYCKVIFGLRGEPCLAGEWIVGYHCLACILSSLVIREGGCLELFAAEGMMIWRVQIYVADCEL